MPKVICFIFCLFLTWGRSSFRLLFVPFLLQFFSLVFLAPNCHLVWNRTSYDFQSMWLEWSENSVLSLCFHLASHFEIFSNIPHIASILSLISHPAKSISNPMSYAWVGGARPVNQVHVTVVPLHRKDWNDWNPLRILAVVCVIISGQRYSIWTSHSTWGFVEEAGKGVFPVFSAVVSLEGGMVGGNPW